MGGDSQPRLRRREWQCEDLVFTTGVNAARVTRTDKTSVYFSAIKASALVDRQNVATAKAAREGLAYDHNISPRLFMNIFNDYEYDQFQNLDLRFVLSKGWAFAVKTERTFLDVLAGADYNHSKFSTPLTRNAAELYWGDEFGYKLSGATSLVQSFRMFNDLSETGRYRVNFDIGASTKLAKWLNWNVSVSDRYLSSPAPGRKTNDFLYTTGIGVNFARSEILHSGITRHPGCRGTRGGDSLPQLPPATGPFTCATSLNRPWVWAKRIEHARPLFQFVPSSACTPTEAFRRGK